MSNPFENPFRNVKESKIEGEENKAEKVSENRGNLFGRITERVLREREEAGNDMANMPETEKNVYDLMKKIPVVRGILVANEGVMGGEPRKKLNTKESLIKYGTGVLMMMADVIKIQQKKETGKDPEHVFKGRTLDWLGQITQQRTEQKPGDKKTQAMQTIYNFLKENGRIIENFEGKLEEVARGQ